MADAEYLNIEDCKIKLAPDQAHFLNRGDARSVPLSDEKEIHIAWSFSILDNFSSFENFLQDYTWATNTNKQRWVEDPVIDDIPVYGKWRQAFITRIERTDDRGNTELLVVLTLRRGFIKVLVSDTETDWSEARVGAVAGLGGAKCKIEGESAKDIVIEWGGVDPFSVETICESIRTLYAGTTFTPTIRGEAYGELSFVSVEWSISPDGSATIQLHGIHTTDITEIDDLDNLTPEILDKNQILDQFSFEEGERDHIAYRYYPLSSASRSVCRDFTDSSLATKHGLSGWEYAERDFRQPKNGICSFTVVFRKVAWSAWGHDSGEVDNVEYQNAGTTREIKTRTWEGIQISDTGTAAAQCSAGTGFGAPDSGYIATVVRIRDNQNGSITVRQVIASQQNNESLTYVVARYNAHGLQFGDVTTISVIYENFTEALLPPGTAVGASNTIRNVKSQQSNGLYQREVVSETVSWMNAWAGKVKAAVATKSGELGEAVTLRATGIPTSSVVSALAAIEAAGGEIGYTLNQTVLSERAQGESVIESRQKKVHSGATDGDAVIREITIGGINVVTREWYRRTSAAKTTLTTPVAGIAVSDFPYDGNNYKHGKCLILDHYDGAYSVVQTGRRGNSGTGSMEPWWSGATDLGWDETEVKIVMDKSSGALVRKKVKIVTHWTSRVASSASSAHGIIDDPLDPGEWIVKGSVVGPVEIARGVFYFKFATQTDADLGAVES